MCIYINVVAAEFHMFRSLTPGQDRPSGRPASFAGLVVAGGFDLRPWRWRGEEAAPMQPVTTRPFTLVPAELEVMATEARDGPPDTWMCGRHGSWLGMFHGFPGFPEI